MFIVFEGMDGSGKTSQSHIMTDWLASAGFSVLWTCEPTYTDTGANVRRGIKLMNKTHLGLARDFASDRCAHQTAIKHFKATHKSPIVICDRYIASSLAYQWESENDEEGFTKIWNMNKDFFMPDLILYLRVSKDKASERLSERASTIALEAQNRFDETERRYLQALEVMQTHRDTIKVAMIDADASVDDVQAQIRDIVSLHTVEFLR